MISPAIIDWKEAPSRGIVRIGEAHLWLVEFSFVREHLVYLESLLSSDEAQRAGRFLFPADRERFILSRGALREILSRYLGQAPPAIQFVYQQQGKPALAGEADRQRLSFNASHAESLALIALSDGRAVGVDVECIREDRMNIAIARRFFSPGEVEKLLSLPESRQAEAFFNGWTRKEAFLKACGEGLRMPLGAIEVSLDPGEDAGLLAVAGDPAAALQWSLIPLVPKPGYVGALVVQGGLQNLLCYRWQFQAG